MKRFLLMVAALAVAAPALAQEILATEPAPAATTAAPATTTSTATTAAPAKAPSQADIMMEHLQKALQAKDNQQALQRGLAVATLMGCTSKYGGKAQTDAFYKQMQAVGKKAEAFCKAGKPDEARLLVLNTMKANRYNQVVMAANTCYTSQKADFDALAGPAIAEDVAKYARWVRDPAIAQREMKNEDICK